MITHVFGMIFAREVEELLFGLVYTGEMLSVSWVVDLWLVCKGSTAGGWDKVEREGGGLDKDVERVVDDKEGREVRAFP